MCLNVYIYLIDSVLNDAMLIVTECLRLIPTNHLPTLSDIQSAKLCRLGVKVFLTNVGTLGSDHILYGLLSGDLDACQARQRFRF